MGTDGVVEPVLGEAEADVDVDVLGSDLRVRGYSGLASSSSFIIERESGARAGDGDGRRGLTGSPSMLLTSSTFTFNGDLDRGSSSVIEDVEASGEGYSCSDLRVIVRNLDMGLMKDSAEDNEQGRALVGLGNKRGYPLLVGAFNITTRPVSATTVSRRTARSLGQPTCKSTLRDKQGSLALKQLPQSTLSPEQVFPIVHARDRLCG